MADAIFINYRRDDSEGEAGRLFEDLSRAFGNDAVFMDVTGIKPGVDFRQAIEDNVAVCGVFLAIVGPAWATIANSEGVRRLHDPRDFVALELATALNRKVPVIPVLVHDAKMPSADLLPENLRAFCYRNSVEISHTRWSSDVQILIKALEPYVKRRTPFPPPPRPRRSKVWLGIAVAAVVILALVALVGNRSGENNEEHTGTSSASAPETPTIDTQQAREDQPTVDDTSDQSSSPPKPIITGPQHPGLIGTWRYPSVGYGNSLSRLVVSTSGTLTFMHPYGFCQPVECDWGTQSVIFNGPLATSVFRLDPYMENNGSMTQRMVKVIALPSSGNLNIVVQNSFQNTVGGYYNNEINVVFVPDK